MPRFRFSTHRRGQPGQRRETDKKKKGLTHDQAGMLPLKNPELSHHCSQHFREISHSKNWTEFLRSMIPQSECSLARLEFDGQLHWCFFSVWSTPDLAYVGYKSTIEIQPDYEAGNCLSPILLINSWLSEKLANGHWRYRGDHVTTIMQYKHALIENRRHVFTTFKKIEKTSFLIK